MSAYLFQIELQEVSEEIISILPEQQKLILKLLSEEVLVSYSVSVKQEFIWGVLQAENETEAMETIASFPLRKFFKDASCHELLYHHTRPVPVSEISLN